MISATAAFRNKEEGLNAERIFGTLTVTNTHFINNSANGLRILDSNFLPCILHKLTTKGNVHNGFYLQRVGLKSNVSDSAFDENAFNGFAIANGAGEVEFRNITAVLNTYSGVRIYDGKVTSYMKFSNLSNNKEDGCCITNQAGAHQFSNCTANANLRHGVSLFDLRLRSSRYRFKQFSIRDSTINDNTQYGVSLAPEGIYPTDIDSTVNVTMAIANNQFVRNRRGGIFLSPNWDNVDDGCVELKPRRMEAIVTKNYFKENKVNVFYMYCVRAFGIDAIIESNKFINNTDKVLTLVDNNNCCYTCENVAVNVTITRNTFLKNRAENVLFIDYSSFPETSSAIVRNNTFKDNEAATKDLLPNYFRRTTSRAVIVFNEGTFTLRDNILENPSFAFQLSTLRHDHRRSIDARFNWWGTTKECEIVDRIFDFQHRVQLSPVDFFPYLLSSNKTRAISSSIARPSCFLRGSSVGGIVDRPLSLPSDVSRYEVRDDVIILTNGSLVIPKNVTLQFPSRSAMVVQGTLLVEGTENEKVRFAKKQHQGCFHLGRGPGPWEGRVEFLLNNTWWPLCLLYNRSFINEAKIICQQLDLYYQTYRVISPLREEEGFVQNVVYVESVHGDIMNCSAHAWSYGPTCRGYTVHVYCQQYNWAGLHLTMTEHQSSLHHLEIHDAGFAYRSDIQIPGAALKVDLSHHNISNIFINNSVGVGVQVVYQSLVHNQSLMPHSTVSNTKSHGVLSHSPSLTLAEVNLTRNNGNGFVSLRTRGKSATYANEMASADMNKVLHVCTKTKTFLFANKVFHFTLETLEYSLQLSCQHVLETEPGFKIVIQEDLYSSYWFPWHFLDVYDGTNTSNGSPWKMGSTSWKDPRVFNSTNSSVVFHLYNSASMSVNVDFFVYTVKG